MGAGGLRNARYQEPNIDGNHKLYRECQDRFMDYLVVRFNGYEGWVIWNKLMQIKKEKGV